MSVTIFSINDEIDIEKKEELNISLYDLNYINNIWPFKKVDYEVGILRYVHNKNQTDIAKFIGVSQPMVSYILDIRLPTHIRRILDLLTILPEHIEIMNADDDTTPMQKMVINLSFYSGSKSYAGKAIKTISGKDKNNNHIICKYKTDLFARRKGDNIIKYIELYLLNTVYNRYEKRTKRRENNII